MKKRGREKRTEGKEEGGGRQTDRLETEAVLSGEQTRARPEHPLYVLRHIISNISISPGGPSLRDDLSQGSKRRRGSPSFC